MSTKQKQEFKQDQEALKFLSEVPEEQAFYCMDGRILKDMNDLEKALDDMSDETFAYHSNTEKKDFSNWVADVIGDNKLAEYLEGTLERDLAAEIVAGRITCLTKMSAWGLRVE